MVLVSSGTVDDGVGGSGCWTGRVGGRTLGGVLGRWPPTPGRRTGRPGRVRTHTPITGRPRVRSNGWPRRGARGPDDHGHDTPRKSHDTDRTHQDTHTTCAFASFLALSSADGALLSRLLVTRGELG